MPQRTLRFQNDLVAQLDRVSVSETGGHEFESHRDHHAKVAELVDALVSGASTARREGSSPSFRTISAEQKKNRGIYTPRFFFFCLEPGNNVLPCSSVFLLYNSSILILINFLLSFIILFLYRQRGSFVNLMLLFHI